MNEFSLKDEDHLIKLADKYPWCAPAQFFLLHQNKKNNVVEFEKQWQKTALFFTDAKWLNWQLHLLSAREQEEKKIINKEEIIEINNSEDENAGGNKIEETADNSTADKKNDDTLIVFEPLHTTDYFASQGIKITEEVVANDKLGTQLKSFTQWLKSMKKIHKESLSLPPDNSRDELTDKKIQRIAEDSNADAEIATEAMAEVLIKQDKIDKAIEVYQKLSLNNPSKSAYFAAKINSLKTS